MSVDQTKGPSRTQKRASQLVPSSLASSTTSQAPLTSDSVTFHDSFTPTTASAQYPFDSPNGRIDTGPPPAKPTAVRPPPVARLMSSDSLLGAVSVSPQSGPGSAPASTLPTSLQPGSSSSTRLPQSLASSSTSSLGISLSTSSVQASSSTGPSEKERSRAKDAAHSAAKSFRVTLEDPCWKVLPAALKKYKINDDWKMYALFICFGNTGALGSLWTA